MTLDVLLARFGRDGIVVVYDGGCPFCTNYVQLARLRETAGPVQLVDARADPALCDLLLAMGCDLDRGMVMLHEGRIYHGSACVQRMAALETGATLVGRLSRRVFRVPWLARLLYPVMVAGRNLTLAILRRPRLWAPRDGRRR